MNNRTDIFIKMRICIRCNIPKLDEDFPKTTSGALSKICKDCNKKYQDRYYRDNREKFNSRGGFIYNSF